MKDSAWERYRGGRTQRGKDIDRGERTQRGKDTEGEGSSVGKIQRGKDPAWERDRVGRTQRGKKQRREEG
jgi:hypothetical protein